MNAKYIRRHLRCGKSRIRPNVRFPKAVWFGVPGSDHFVRSYPKPAVGGFRVEQQCNPKFLLRHKVNTAADIVRLPQVLAQQMGFYRMDWAQLSAHVRRRPRYAEVILQRAHEKEECLNDLLRFLRRVRIFSAERFLISLPVNSEMQKAVRRCEEQWKQRNKVSQQKKERT